jgi:chaperonin GroES
VGSVGFFDSVCTILRGREKRTTMRVTPLFDRVLVKRVKKEERTPTGLVIPDVAREKPQRGVVVGVGTGKVLEDGKVRPMKVQPGDEVIFARNVGDDLVLDEIDHVIVREEDLLAVVQ